MKKSRVRKIKTRNWLWRQIILFIKELKRVRWPSMRLSSKEFVKILLFTAVFAGFSLAVATAATQIWIALGVGA